MAGVLPAVAAGLALLIVVAVLPGAAADTVVVAPTQLDGWQFNHGTCGAPTTGNQTFVVGPPVPPLGVGSLRIMVGSNGDSYETFRHSGLNGTLLSDLTSLSYSAYTTVTGSGGQAIYMNLGVSTTGGSVADDLLFFEPLYQSGFNSSIPSQGPPVVGSWQSWDALVGGWWSVNGFAGAGPGGDVRTLADYAAAFPAATIVDGSTGGIRLSAGCGGADWAGFDGNVDNVTIGSTTWGPTTFDFEPVAPVITTTSSTSPSVTPTTEIPVFPSPLALALAALIGFGGAFVMMRRRKR